MNRWNGRVALVTGASSGIGAAICRQLVEHGMTVIGAARSHSKVQELADELKGQKGSLHAIRCDISKDNDVRALFATIKQKHGGVDVCINNAGIDSYSPLMDGDVNKWRAMFDVNVIGLSHCTREALVSMKERKVDDGQIIHISSIAGHVVISPQMVSAMYTASKYAVNALTEGLRQELRQAKSSIRVSSISPGVVGTGFFSAQQNVSEEKAKEMMGAMLEFKVLEASDIADSAIYILAAPPHVEIDNVMIRPTGQQF
ncbi:unnamed protein product [Meganyctiphanes norvegica]|uniref:Dehydrogenase/reductase SDR family member 11 n=1 Tax=Meganyctiphanes norvegica TaxID=48144 RepID=A0AAV2RHY8_MEGNR